MNLVVMVFVAVLSATGVGEQAVDVEQEIQSCGGKCCMRYDAYTQGCNWGDITNRIVCRSGYRPGLRKCLRSCGVSVSSGAGLPELSGICKQYGYDIR